MSPDVDSGLQAVMVCLCRVINCNKYTTLALEGMLISGGGWGCGRGYKGICNFLFNFAVN